MQRDARGDLFLLTNYRKISDHWEKFIPDDLIVSEFRSGKFINQIAKQHHVGPARIKEALKKEGLYP